MRRCNDCHSQFRQNTGTNRPLKINAFQDVINEKFQPIDIDDVENEIQRSQFLAIDVNSIRKFQKRSKFNADRYRVKTKVFNKSKTKNLEALLDTGCNTDALSLAACQELGSDGDIQPPKSIATGVDGHNLNVVGTVSTTLHVGNVPYTNTFPVLKNIADFDVMIGTRFMQSTNLMSKVFDLMQDNLGAEHVERTN